ncbi:SDR family oxidoreductase [Candidatus Dojkabacteria bacterium]|uniref:SDR family oxidoreductase n=1 Tax=Candidatus Dojkabacteria bacterium TaxID=2099670 RepID=A0A955L3G8_9BACT|nr:SDR family oxidoreductase [Candidatus Dojkabacteria bacterium]
MDQKVALVTGSTRGIGKAVAQRLLLEGHIVVISSELPVKEKHVLKDFENNKNAVYIKADISNLSDLTNLRDAIIDKFGTIDYLVANAGIMPLPCGIDDVTEEVMNKTSDVNLKGTFNTLKLFGDAIQKYSKHNGAIVTLTSVDGIIGEPYGVIYSATKAGIISLTKSFARKLANPLVRVNAVAPGLIDTPLTATTGEDPSWTTDLSIIKRMGKPEEIANAINFLLSDEASFITGQVLAVDGGFTLK